MAHSVEPPAYLGRDRELVAGPAHGQPAVRARRRRPHWRPSPRRPATDLPYIPVLAAFDHEENGSQSDTGADGPLLGSVLERSVFARGGSYEDRARAFAGTVCLSSDTGHAVHPNYAERHDPTHHPRVNGGPILKVNVNKRYATDGSGRAVFAAACEKAGVPLAELRLQQLHAVRHDDRPDHRRPARHHRRSTSAWRSCRCTARASCAAPTTRTCWPTRWRRSWRAELDFSLLGSVAVTSGPPAAPVELPLGPSKRRSVLAMLLLRPNSTVSVEQLISSLWEDEPPEHARTVIQGHVSRLRAVLAEGGADDHGVELTTHSSAYLLRVPETLIDTQRFDRLVAHASPEAAPADAVHLLRQALALWRGPALTGTVASPPFAAAPARPGGAAAGRRGDPRPRARGARRIREGSGRPAPAALANPLREGLIAALMLALYRTGRQSDAIAWFHRTRQLLADDLGVDPGERLSRRVPGDPAGRTRDGARRGAEAPGRAGQAGGTGHPGGQPVPSTPRIRCPGPSPCPRCSPAPRRASSAGTRS